MSTRIPASLWERMLGAIRLDPNLCEEVEADTEANGQALAVVVLASLAAGIGVGCRWTSRKGTFVVPLGPHHRYWGGYRWLAHMGSPYILGG